MTPRAILFAWGMGLAFALIFVLAIRSVESAHVASCPVMQNPGSEAPAIVIGSSLTRYAFATDKMSTGLIADATVWAVNALGPDQGMHLLQCALETAVPQILVEASTFAFPYEEGGGDKRSISERLDRFLTAFTREARLSIGRIVLGERDVRIRPTPAAALPNPDWNGTRPALSQSPRTPIHTTWAEPLRELNARHAGRIVLFDPPRTLLQVQDIARGFDPAQALAALSEGAGLPLITVGLVWEPANFIDYHSHMHARGRVRFQREFTAAWQKLLDAD